ncbi:MAG TPA: GGDEF domain-containing protein [Gemmatimonadaceae bacterium]
MLTRKLLAVVFPDGVLLLIAVALVHWGGASPAAAPILRFYPVAVLVAGALLGWRFRRGRLLLALAALALADLAMRWLAPFDSGAPYAGPEIVRTVAMVLPAGLAILAFVDERGLLTPAGLRQLAVLGAQAAAVLTVWLVSIVNPESTTHAFDLALLPSGMFTWIPLGQPASLVALVAIAMLVARTLWRPDAESRGFLWAAVGCVIAASAGPAGGRATLHLANAGLVLVVATVESAYAMAYHDELTGLPARRALNDALLRVSGTYTVAMVDVDHFKDFNDTHGHDVGDQVLRMVAGRLARVGGGGRVFRYGGEEFAVLFPGKSAEESAPHLESLREAVAGANFTKRGKDRPRRKPKSPRARGANAGRLAVTVSIGAAQGRESALPDHVLKAADKALYRAKQGGRNRVEV